MKTLRVLIVGLDGASYSDVEEGARSGRLPFLARVRREGRLGKLRTVIPAVSPAAWSSFLTGLHPGRHGILHFLQSNTRDPEASESLITSRPVRGRTFFDGLARSGFRIASVSVPATYPPWDVGAVMVSGYPCPEGRWSIHPPDVEVSTPPSSQVATVAGTDQEGPLLEAVSAMWRRRDLVTEIASIRSPDVLMVVFSLVDHVQHLYGWEGDRRRIFSAYREGDRLLEDLYSRIGSDTLFMIVSDHGGAPPPRRLFRTKRWLIEAGLAKEAPRVPVSAAVGSGPVPASDSRVPDWVMADSRFLAQIAAGAAEGVRQASGAPAHLDTRGMDEGRSKVIRFRLCDLSEGLVVNVAGRQRSGVVRPGELDVVRRSIVEAAENLRRSNSGRDILRDVLTREQLFPGASADRDLPDVVLLLEDGVKATGDVDGPIVDRIDHRVPSARGVHSLDGIWGLMGPGVVPGSEFEASILDVAPTLLAHLGVGQMHRVDGRVRADLISIRQDTKAPSQRGES